MGVRTGLRGIAALLPPLLLAACGGGVFFSFGNGDFDAPSVSIATGQSSVPAGGTLSVVAAASDNESGVDEVAFYRLDGSAAVRLGSDGSAPYEWLFDVPSDGRTTLRVFARAFDGAGNAADSAVLEVAITP